MSSRSTSPKPEQKGERVQKVLARTGFASRREIDKLILAGRVVIDNRPAVPGDRLLGTEKVQIDGKLVRLGEPKADTSTRVLLYHKPVGEISARKDPERRKTVFDSLPRAPHGRWILIGRLDINTSGLLLLTTDGELAHRLMHPSFEVEREYAVRIRGTLNDSQFESVCQGVYLEDGPASFEAIEPMNPGTSNSWYRVTLKEGRNREVRRIFEAIDVTVSRLIRIRYGSVNLDRLKRGGYRLLSPAEIGALRKEVAGDADGQAR